MNHVRQSGTGRFASLSMSSAIRLGMNAVRKRELATHELAKATQLRYAPIARGERAGPLLHRAGMPMTSGWTTPLRAVAEGTTRASRVSVNVTAYPRPSALLPRQRVRIWPMRTPRPVFSTPVPIMATEKTSQTSGLEKPEKAQRNASGAEWLRGGPASEPGAPTLSRLAARSPASVTTAAGAGAKRRPTKTAANRPAYIHAEAERPSGAGRNQGIAATSRHAAHPRAAMRTPSFSVCAIDLSLLWV